MCQPRNLARQCATVFGDLNALAPTVSGFAYPADRAEILKLVEHVDESS
ncbi:MAG TPA: hypothetical protein VFF07_07515 [Actinomycetota bacterium]|nr:hypothetical protein [Actinomycetota bacterium]